MDAKKGGGGKGPKIFQSIVVQFLIFAGGCISAALGAILAHLLLLRCALL